MPELLQEYWLLILIALAIGVVVAWWIFHASRKTTVQREELEEGQTAAKRNQALIDAPPAAVHRTAGPDNSQTEAEMEAMEGVGPGPLSAAANTQEVAHAGEEADAEAGAPGSAREALQEMKASETPSSSPTPAPAPEPAPMIESDDLRRIKGVGPKLVTILHGEGVNSFSQIAAWSDGDIDRIDAKLGRFQGRIRRDDWVQQARFLAADDIAGYEDKFGKV